VIEHGRSGIIVDNYRQMAAALDEADDLDPFELRRYVEEEFSPAHTGAPVFPAAETASERAGAGRR
jgi:hypothetical protein